MLVPTCGNLFRGVAIRDDYPIPDFTAGLPLHGPLLEIGCSWGRWSIAAAKAGYRVVAIDPHLQALLCAQWLARKLVPDNQPLFVLADARRLPFRAETFTSAFSYSVIQHFSRPNAARTLQQVGNSLQPGGLAMVQMPNYDGLARYLFNRREPDRKAVEFDVRYYGINELLALFEATIGRSSWQVDCFLGLNVHAADRRLLPRTRWPILWLAEALRFAAARVPFMAHYADSVFISAVKEA